MQREIKFRGKTYDSKEWVYGSLHDYSPIGRSIYVNDIASETTQGVMVQGRSVGQFTGLKDKNGIEIYEGDLLYDPYPIDDEDLSKGYNESSVPVAWCSEKLQWCIDASYAKDGSFLTSLTEYFGDELEVIGNIYEQQTKKQ